jgi:single-strand DNA-binding protein
LNSLNATVRLGNDAELRYSPANDAVCQFNAALTSGYGKNAKTSWLRCTVWGKKAETLAPMLRKGNQIAITGEITLTEYTGKDGIKKTSLECRVSDVTLLGGKDGATGKTQGQEAQSNDNDFPDDDPDSIPF